MSTWSKMCLWEKTYVVVRDYVEIRIRKVKPPRTPLAELIREVGRGLERTYRVSLSQLTDQLVEMTDLIQLEYTLRRIFAEVLTMGFLVREKILSSCLWGPSLKTW